MYQNSAIHILLQPTMSLPNGRLFLHLASDDSDHRPFQICILMEIHDTHNQVSFHIYILQMQRSPTRPLNSACRDGRPNTLALGPNTLVQGPNTLVPGPNSRAQHEGMAPGPSLLISNMQTGLLPSSHRTIMIHCKSGQVFLFSLFLSCPLSETNCS